MEQYPFEMKAKLAKGIAKLKKMSETLSLVELDSSDWPILAKHLDDLKAGNFHSVELRESMTRKLTRSQTDIGDLQCFTTVQNRLKSLAKNQAKIIEKRTIDNADHPYPEILDVMSKCLDMQSIVDNFTEEGFDIDASGKAEFEELCKLAGLSDILIRKALDQYLIFKKKVQDIVKDE